MSMPANSIKKCRCNICQGKTEHDVVEHNDVTRTDADGTLFNKATYVLKCRGCQSYTIYTESHFSEWGPGEIERVYSPPRLWFRAPEWTQELEEVDPPLYELLQEVYSAANKHQARLLSMGVRAALDHAMVRIIGDIGGFDKKLNEMVKQQHITEKQGKMLDTVIDVGSAAAHRGYRPPKELLEHMVSIMETIIREHYITGPMLQAVRSQVPPRPPRKFPATQPDDI